MNEKNDDAAPLLGPRPQPRGADQPQLLQPAKPSSSPAGGTTILQIAVPNAAVDTVQHVLAEAGDLIGAIMDAGTPAPAAPAPKRSHVAAQSLVAGLLLGLGKKYSDQDLSNAGQGLQAKILGAPVTAPAKPQPSKFKPSRSKARKGKR